MSKLRRIAALGLTAVLLGGCVPQKVAAPEKAEETKAEEAKTEESQAKNEAKNEGTNETAAEADGRSHRDGDYGSGGDNHMASVF